MSISRREFNRISLGVASALALPGPALAGPEHQVKRSIPSSGEMIPIIGLGTNRYGVGADQQARAALRATLSRFAELGGTVLDTAPGYRTSETVLGDLIADLGLRKHLFIATKVDRPHRDESEARMRASLQKLRTETVDLMQVHNLQGWQASLPLMREWKQDGHIRYIGVTTSRYEQFEGVEAILRSEQLDFVQLNYSVARRKAAERLMPLAADRGVAVMINRAFGAGRIFRALGERPLPAWAADFDCTSWAQLLLKYALSHPAATVAIPGMTKAHHVEDNLRAGQGRMPDAAERDRIEDYFDSI
jgi:aryl-alcohol dehydrogenase-like predicted oxidoreductase